MNKKDLQANLLNGSKWLRLVFMLLFWAVAWVLECIVWIIAVVQFLYTLFTDKPLASLHNFSASLSSYIYQIVQFLTYVSEEKPFPFTHWPTAVHKATKSRGGRTINQDK